LNRIPVKFVPTKEATPSDVNDAGKITLPLRAVQLKKAKVAMDVRAPSAANSIPVMLLHCENALAPIVINDFGKVSVPVREVHFWKCRISN
jgi:hypothetical protein